MSEEEKNEQDSHDHESHGHEHGNEKHEHEREHEHEQHSHEHEHEKEQRAHGEEERERTHEKRGYSGHDTQNRRYHRRSQLNDNITGLLEDLWELHQEVAFFAMEKAYKHLDKIFGDKPSKSGEKKCCADSKAEEQCCTDTQEKDEKEQPKKQGHSHSHNHTHEHAHDSEETQTVELSGEDGHSHDEEGHEHEHTHEHSADEEYTGITTHDESIVGSIRRFYPGAYSEAVDYMKGKVKTIAEKVTSAGGIIGHIKAFIRAEGDSCMLSVTDDESDSNVRDYVSSKNTLELASIVFLITKEQLLQILIDEFGEINVEIED